MSTKDRLKTTRDVTQLVLARKPKHCNFVEYKDSIIVYRRYASLYFLASISPTDNPLITLEIIHRYVEQMDRYYGNVCELDIIFNFQKAYAILDELLLAGEMVDSGRREALKVVQKQDDMEELEVGGVVS